MPELQQYQIDALMPEDVIQKLMENHKLTIVHGDNYHNGEWLVETWVLTYDAVTQSVRVIYHEEDTQNTSEGDLERMEPDEYYLNIDTNLRDRFASWFHHPHATTINVSLDIMKTCDRWNEMRINPCLSCDEDYPLCQWHGQYWEATE